MPGSPINRREIRIAACRPATPTDPVSPAKSRLGPRSSITRGRRTASPSERDYEHRLAAKALRIPEGTLTTRVFRARQKVAAALERETPAAGRVSAGRASLPPTTQPS